MVSTITSQSLSIRLSSVFCEEMGDRDQSFFSMLKQALHRGSNLLFTGEGSPVNNPNERGDKVYNTNDSVKDQKS